MEDMRVTLGGCLLCAVRQLTQGKAPLWRPLVAGDQVAGVVMKVQAAMIRAPGQDVSAMSVTLWTGGADRVRVESPNAIFVRQVQDAQLEVGDRVNIRFLGDRTIDRGEMAGRTIRDWEVTVERGHH